MEKLNYVQLMEDEKLTLAELPTDAKTGIKEIANTLKIVKLNEGKGKKPSEAVLGKLKMLDKNVVTEINSYLDEKEKTPPAEPVVEPVVEKEDANAIAMEAEMDELIKEGLSEITIEGLKSKAPKVYNSVFDNYTEGGENGIQLFDKGTPTYSLIEKEKGIFAVAKM